MKNAEQARAGQGRGGFSLVEVMVATAIVAIFGLMAVATLRYGSGLWRSGHRRSYAYDLATMVFGQLDDDISATKSQFWCLDKDAFDTRVKFWVDYDTYDPDGAGGVLPEYRQRLRLVRGIPDDTVNPRLRQAGTDPAAYEYYNLKDDPDPTTGLRNGQVDENLKPLEGMCEVAYLMGLDPADRHTLYRAVLAPIGGQPAAPTDPGMTFFHGNLDPTLDTFGDAQSIRNKAMRLADNVLYWEVRCRTQYTTTWDPAVVFSKWPYSYRPVTCGPAFTWDSDRLNYTTWSPPFVMDWGTSNFADSDDDLDGTYNSADPDYVRDNVFPRAIMVILVADVPQDMQEQNPLRLASPVNNANDTTISIAGTLPAYNEKWPLIFIEDQANGDEWVQFQSFDPQAGQFKLAGPEYRGARMTAAAAHPAGCLVKFGHTFSRVFDNPTGREYWGQ